MFHSMLAPTKEDTAAIKKQVDKLAADFKTAKNDSLFSAINSDVKVPFTYLTKGMLDPAVDSVVFNLPQEVFMDRFFRKFLQTC